MVFHSRPHLLTEVMKSGDFEIVDTIQVPERLIEGDFVLSWRWDSEQTPPRLDSVLLCDY